AEEAADQIGAAFTPGVSVVIADLTRTACRDRGAIRYLLKAHRKAAVRGRQCDSRSAPAARCTDHRLGRHPSAARGLPHPPARHDRQITQVSPAIAIAITSSSSMTGPAGQDQV